MKTTGRPLESMRVHLAPDTGIFYNEWSAGVPDWNEGWKPGKSGQPHTTTKDCSLTIISLPCHMHDSDSFCMPLLLPTGDGRHAVPRPSGQPEWRPVNRKTISWNAAAAWWGYAYSQLATLPGTVVVGQDQLVAVSYSHTYNI